MPKSYYVYWPTCQQQQKIQNKEIHHMGKCMKQKWLEMVQITVFFFFMKSEKLRRYVICKIGKNQCFLAITGSFFWFHQNLKKNWNSNLNNFQQFLFHTLFPPIFLISPFFPPFPCFSSLFPSFSLIFLFVLFSPLFTLF